MLGSAAAAAATGGGGKQVTEGFSRAQHTKLSDRLTTDWDSQATVLDEEPEEGDTDDKLTQKIMSFHEFIHES